MVITVLHCCAKRTLSTRTRGSLLPWRAPSCCQRLAQNLPCSMSVMTEERGSSGSSALLLLAMILSTAALFTSNSTLQNRECALSARATFMQNSVHKIVAVLEQIQRHETAHVAEARKSNRLQQERKALSSAAFSSACANLGRRRSCDIKRLEQGKSGAVRPNRRVAVERAETRVETWRSIFGLQNRTTNRHSFLCPLRLVRQPI